MNSSLPSSVPAPEAHGRAIYVHMPFCYTACVFCSCLKIVTRDGGEAARYLDYLERDMAAQVATPGAGRKIARMYRGGGTPTYYTMSQLRRVWRALRQEFEFAEDGEYTIEIDPHTVNESSIVELDDMGFTIASLAVPDLAPTVLDDVVRGAVCSFRPLSRPATRDACQGRLIALM